MSLDVLNPSILKNHKPKGGFCAVTPDQIDDNKYALVTYDFGFESGNDWVQGVDGFANCEGATMPLSGFFIIFGGNTTPTGDTAWDRNWGYLSIYDSFFPIAYTDRRSRKGHQVVSVSNGRTYMLMGSTTDAYNGSEGGHSVAGNSVTGWVSSWDTVETISATISAAVDMSSHPDNPGSRRVRFSACLWDHKIYCYGGYDHFDENTKLYDIDVFDPYGGADTGYGYDFGSWSTGNGTNSTFTPNEAIVDPDTGLMYVPSYDNDDDFMEMRICNLSTYAWTSLTTLGNDKPIRRRDHTLELYNGNIFMVGGRKHNNNDTLEEIWIYNIENNRWLQFPWPETRSGSYYHYTEVIDGTLVLTGGLSGSSFNQQIWMYDLDHIYYMALRISRGNE